MASTATAAPRISPIDAAQQAVERTRRQLFPFRFDRWLALGFVAFLDQCGRAMGSGGGTGGGGSSTRGDGVAGFGPSIPGWLDLGWTVGLALCVVALVLLVVVLVVWLNSRGVFMYVDNVATGGAHVVRTWRRNRVQAKDYFVWNLGLILLTLAGVLALVVPGVILGLSFHHQGFRLSRLLALVFLGFLLVCVLIVAGLASVLLRDFVAPIQFRRKVGCRQALEVAMGMVVAHPAAFLVYVLLKAVLAAVLMAVGFLAGCLTCCLGFLPVVRQTLLQPIYYFERAWSLELLRQLGEDPFAAAEP